MGLISRFRAWKQKSSFNKRLRLAEKNNAEQLKQQLKKTTAPFARQQIKAEIKYRKQLPKGKAGDGSTIKMEG